MEEVQAPLPAGTLIYEHYIIEILLGKGDFGNLYLVRDQRDEQKLFALAELFNPAPDESYRFALNYVSRAPLDRHVLPRVQYVYHDSKHGRAYLLMNYIEEPNLELLRLQQAEQRFPLSQVISIMALVVNAVHHLHKQHPPLVHGKITPACIIVSQSMDASVLAMLDLFKEQDGTTTPLHYVAPGYGASEQYEGECSVCTDIYGLGATYYTLLTGVIPPDALSRLTQQKRGEGDPLRPAYEVNPAVPFSIAEVIQRAMSFEPGDRFSSVEQLQSKIAALAEQLPADRVPDTPAIAPLPPVLITPEPQELNSARAEEPDDLRSVASVQAREKPAPAPVPAVGPTVLKASTAGEEPAPLLVPKRRGAIPGRRTHALLIGLAFLLIVGVGADFWFHLRSLPSIQTTAPTPTVILSSPTPAPAATTVASPFPTLAGTYRGTLYDVAVDKSTDMSLSSIRQNQNQISGYLTLGSGIQGSGPFKGIIDTPKRVQFIVTDTAGNPGLFFEGAMQSPTTLTGDYYNCDPTSLLQGNRCTRAPGSYGLWNVILT